MPVGAAPAAVQVVPPLVEVSQVEVALQLPLFPPVKVLNNVVDGAPKVVTPPVLDTAILAVVAPPPEMVMLALLTVEVEVGTKDTYTGVAAKAAAEYATEIDEANPEPDEVETKNPAGAVTVKFPGKPVKLAPVMEKGITAVVFTKVLVNESDELLSVRVCADNLNVANTTSSSVDTRNLLNCFIKQFLVAKVDG